MSGDNIWCKDGIVWDHWRRHAEKTPEREAIIHWSAMDTPYRWTWENLLVTATHVAKYLRESGIKKGDICAIIIRHNKYFYPTYFAISALGALPAVLAFPNARLHPEKFRQGLEGMAKRSGLDYVLTERDLEPMIAPLVSKEGSTVKRMLFPLEWFAANPQPSGEIIEHADTSCEEPCLLQHSSGTTGLQKAVILSHRAVLEHVQRYSESIALSSEDKIVSWLPLYHDMGLIAAYYLPLTFGIPLVQLDPFEWVSAPITLLQAISQEKGTLVWLPNFSYNLMADRLREEDIKVLRFDSLRMVINCSEPVRAESHHKFFKRFSPYGLKREALSACYAMAETTFAATQCPPGQEARKLLVVRDELAKGYVKRATNEQGARVCVSSGAVISGCELKILDDNQQALPEGRVGEIAIKSVSLFDGYRNYPEKTAEVLKDGWYHSGDFGFVDAGEYFVIGRKKDILIIAGNNIYPEDIEDGISQVEGVMPGRVIAFGVDDEQTGTDQICVLAETAIEEVAQQKKVRMAVLKAGMQIDVTISRVYLVPPRWLIKSSSGKPSRSANKERALNELSWK
jgi:fatty-acyl-CoA synthase